MMDERTILEKRLQMAQRVLAMLEQQAAGFTNLTMPVHLQIELEEKREEVATIKAQLQPPSKSNDLPVPPAFLPSQPPVEEREVFISYAWGGESEEIVNKLDRAFQDKGITIVRDKRDLGYKGLIKDFMSQIGRGKCAIAVISDKYLKSENCMFELVEIAKNGDFYDRIFPIVLPDAKIYKATARLQYIQYWDERIKELEQAIKMGSLANLQGITDELNLYTEIRHNIAQLTDILKDMNVLTAERHQQSQFGELFQAIEQKLAE